jgi:hypothetical protein
MARSKRKRIRDYRHELPKDGPGWQTGSDIRRIQWNVLTKMQDLGHDESIPYMLGGIEATATICEDYIRRVTNRLVQLHDLFTEKQVTTTIQAKWFQREVHLTESILADIQSFRALLAAERGIDPRDAFASHQGDSDQAQATGAQEGHSSPQKES